MQRFSKKDTSTAAYVVLPKHKKQFYLASFSLLGYTERNKKNKE